MFSKNNIILTSLYLKLDIRNSEDSGKRKLIGIIITYLFINTMISFGNYQKFDLNVFIFSSLTINLFLIGFVVISDYSDLFFSSKHYVVLESLPIKDENIFTSKISSALIYLSLYPFVVTIPPAIFIYFYNNSITESLLFVLLSFLFSYFVIGLIFLFNSLIIVNSKSRNKILIFILQFLFITFIFSLNKYSSGNAKEFFNSSYLKYLPQYYLLLGYYNVYYIISFITATIILYILVYYFIKRYYSRIAATLIVVSTPIKRKTLYSFNLSWFEHLALKNNTEKASFNLLKNHFRNTSVLKYRLIPLLFLPLVATVVTVFSGMEKMFSTSVFSNSDIMVLNPAISMSLIISARILFSSLVIGFEDDDENILSLYSSLPLENRFDFQKGILKFVNMYFIIPLVILCGIVLTFKIQSIDVFYNLLWIFLFVALFNTIFIKSDKRFPFSVPASKYNNSSKYLQILISMLIGIVLFVSQVFIFKSFIFFIISIFVILLIIVLLNKIFNNNGSTRKL